MAKLHSEIRIKAVDGIAVGNEGQGDQFAEGDIIFNNANSEFMKRNATAYDTNDAAASWDVVSSGGGGGSSDNILEGDTKVEVIDSGSDGRIEFTTENVKKWEITTAGHILPATNDAFDIGSAEYKVRDFYLSNNSLWIGDEHKISIDNGVMKFRRRKFASGDSNLPASLQAEVNAKFANPLAWSESSVIGIGGAGGAYTTAGLAVPNDLSQMTLAHWEVFIAHVQGLQAADGTSVADYGKIFDKGIQSLFKQDTDFVDNFQPGQSTDGFKSSVGKGIDGQADLSGGDDIAPGASGKGLAGITYLAEGHKSGPITFFVGVDNKTVAHPYSGEGSTSAYYINGQESPFLKLKKGVYHFDVSHASNAGHPFKLYTAADKSGGVWSTETLGADNPSALSVEFWEGSTQRDETTYNSVVGQAGVYLKVTISSDTPQILHYQCSAHALMGYEIKNESAVISSGGATEANDLSDVSTANAADGEALVYNSAQSRFEPQPIMTRGGAFVSRRISFNTNGDSAEIIQLHPDIENKSGGRIVIDTANLGNNAGDKVQLNLSELYNISPLDPTMNFEIFSIGTQPFDVELINPASGPTTGAQILYSDMQPDISIAEDASSNISIGEGQMLIIYCDGSSWYHEIRSGL